MAVSRPARALDCARLALALCVLAVAAVAPLCSADAPVAPSGVGARSHGEGATAPPHAGSCSVSVTVDHHSTAVRPALDASLTPLFGWSLDGAACAGVQTSYRVVVTASSAAHAAVWDSGIVRANTSANVPCGVGLTEGTAHSVVVTVTLDSGTYSSTPTPFLTLLSPSTLAAALPVWHTNASATFVLLRRPITLPTQPPRNETIAAVQQAYLTISARPTLDKFLPHTGNASHLLCAYKLWVDGVPLGVGPGRKVGGGINADTYNLTGLLGPGGVEVDGDAGAGVEHVLAVESYYEPVSGDRAGRTGAVGGDGREVGDGGGGVIAILHDGAGAFDAGGAAAWSAFDATAAFGPSAGPKGQGEGSHYYYAPLENMNGALIPPQWRTRTPTHSAARHEVARAGARGDSGWSPAVTTLPWADGVVAKQAMPVSMHDAAAAAFIWPVASQPASTNNSISSSWRSSGDSGSFHYIVDFGRNFQGGLNVTFSQAAVRRALATASAASSGPPTVTVRVGEQLNVSCPRGPPACTVLGVVPLTTNGNRWDVAWALGGPGDSDLTFMPHEYLEFRYAELVGAPEAPTSQLVRAWAVRYPFDGDVNEGTRAPSTGASLKASRRRVASLTCRDGDCDSGGDGADADASSLSSDSVDASSVGTTFASSHNGLNRVWELVRWTVSAAAIDANTDSNTRQRDVCTLDAFLATLYQAAVYPASSYHHVRRVTELMYEPLGYVNDWTEFQTSALGALAHLTYDHDDATLARRVWNATAHEYSLLNFSLTAYYDPARRLVAHTPKPLIDWPRDPSIDIDSSNDHLCDDVCVQMNAHAVTTQSQMAALATRLGLPSKVVAEYAARAAAIRAAANASFVLAAARCNPPGVGPCYADNVVSSSTVRGRGRGTLGSSRSAAAAAVSTTAQATGMAADARLPGTAVGTLGLVPFLRARNSRRGASHGLEVSAWQAMFMLRGVYSAAGETDEGPIAPALAADAAQFGWEVLTGNGTNSWIGGMLGVMNATMTTESWITEGAVGAVPEGGSTMSHPWTASPAVIVPRWLMGVRPLEAGWKRVAVRPLPPPVRAGAPASDSESGLLWASLVTPTPRGVVRLSYAMAMDGAASPAGVLAPWTWDANVTVPGNMRAHICAPLYAAPSTHTCTSSPPTVRAGALACLPTDVVGGVTRLQLRCEPS